MSSASHGNESLVSDTQCGYPWIVDIYLKMPWTWLPSNHRPKEGGQVLPVMWWKAHMQTIGVAHQNDNDYFLKL